MSDTKAPTTTDDDEKPNRRVVVLWSGGCDSTRVLHEALYQAQRDDRDPPIALTVEWSARTGTWGKPLQTWHPVPAGPEQALARHRFTAAMRHT